MAFTATKKEWCELYTFFKLLADGVINEGTSKGEPNFECSLPIAMIQRVEHDGTRNYIIEKDEVRVVNEKGEKAFPREDFDIVSDLIWRVVTTSSSNEIESPDGVEEFLDEIGIYNLEAKTDDRTDFYLAFWDVKAPLVGFRIYAHISGMNNLLDGGRTANLKFEQVGVKFATPTVNKVNMLDTPNEVTERMFFIERLGGQLKYSDVADKVFRSNLLMIDLHFPRLIAEMVRTMHLEGITSVDELTERMKIINPLKIKEELITKHHFYAYKVKQFLVTVALGMRPAKLFNGTDSAVAGFVVVRKDGKIICFHKGERMTFEDYLYHNSRLEKGSLEKDKYGFLEKENGTYYFKLNVKVGLKK